MPRSRRSVRAASRSPPVSSSARLQSSSPRRWRRGLLDERCADRGAHAVLLCSRRPGRRPCPQPSALAQRAAACGRLLGDQPRRRLGRRCLGLASRLGRLLGGSAVAVAVRASPRRALGHLPSGGLCHRRSLARSGCTTDRVVVARNDEVGLVRIAVCVDEGDDRTPSGGPRVPRAVPSEDRR